MQQKSNVASLFTQFKLLVERYFQLPLISIYFDNGGEYEFLKQTLMTNGVAHFKTPPHTLEHNGTAERCN